MASKIQIFPENGVDYARSFLHKAKAVICDIDGVLLTDGRPVTGAKKLLKRHRCVFVSNNSTHTAELLCAQFRDLGLLCEPGDFFLAGDAAVNFMSTVAPRASVMVLASGAIEQKAREKLNVFDRSRLSPSAKPDFVLLCRDQTATFDKLQSAANAIKLGARVILSNPDLTHPAENGMIHTETGALWQAVRVQLENCEPVATIGKPNTELVMKAVQYLGLVPSETVFLGDNLQTDAIAAANAGIPFIHTGGNGFRLSDLIA